MKRQSAFIYSLCDNFSNPSCHGFIDKIKIFYLYIISCYQQSVHWHLIHLSFDDLVHIVQGFAGAVIDICIEQQLHTRSLCSRIEFFKFPIVIDSGTVNFSYMLYYVTFANQIICTFSLVLKSPLVKFARLLSVYL